MIEEPANLRIFHELDIRIDCVPVIDGDPGPTCAHDAEHTDENSRVVQRVDRRAVLGIQSLRMHGRCEHLCRVAQLGITVANVPVHEGRSSCVLFRSFIEIIDRSHRVDWPAL